MEKPSFYTKYGMHHEYEMSRKQRLDPLLVLRRTKDPVWAQWAVQALEKAGFRDPLGIARDFGWVLA